MFEAAERLPRVGALDEFLVAAKLSVPDPRSGTVSRAELIETARSSDRRVVGVTAPPGYGKSTLLAEWAQIEDRPVAWVSLDRWDDDPLALLTLLASAYARVSPGEAELIADVSGPGVSVLGRAAPRLASAFRTSARPFVLMLDDVHELQSPDCQDVLGMVISGFPAGSQLVAVGRTEQPYLLELRSSGGALEFGAADLAFDATGAQQIFSDAQVPLAPELAAAVVERTEGWPVGVYLAALTARDSDGDVLAIAGDDRYVADYLHHEALTQLPERTRRFLRRTAVLDQLCAPLCDAVLGEIGAEEELHTLEASRLFLNPLDRRRGRSRWYRYHPLFREFLLGELRRIEPDVIPKLHLRAADWYESSGSPVIALEHLLSTPELERCIQLATALVLPTCRAGQMSRVRCWLAAIGDAAIEDHPPLAVLAGWITALSGRTVEAQRWAAIVDAAAYDLPPLDGTASFDSAGAMLRAVMCPAGPERLMADATLALAQEPPSSAWRDTALCMRAEAHLLAGEVDDAAKRFAETSTVGAALGHSDTVVLSESELAVLAMDSGRWEEAARRLHLTLAIIEEHRMHDFALSVLAFAGAARLAVHQGDVREADRQVTRAMRARPSCTFALPFVAVRVRLQLARVYWSRGDQTTARHLLREIDDILLHRPALGGLVGEVSELREVLTSSTPVGATGGPPLTPAELRLLPYLQTHLTIREIAERAFVSRNTVSSEVSSIYRKLGVSSRGEAVREATAIGLLGG